LRCFVSSRLVSSRFPSVLLLQVLRVFVCQLVNTALLVLLVKSSMPPFDGLPGDHYNNVNSKWYANIAAPMLITVSSTKGKLPSSSPSSASSCSL
jgi:hypothetical protein